MRHGYIVAGLVALFTAAGGAAAQVGSTLQSINLVASKGETVTLGAPNPAMQSLTIVDGALNQYTTPFSITVSWDVSNSTSTTVKLVGYFATPSGALMNGGSAIESSRIEVSIDAGANWAAFTGNAVGGVGSVGGSAVLYTSPVTQGANRSGSLSVTFLIRINLVGAPSTAAGVYTGTLNLMAICS